MSEFILVNDRINVKFARRHSPDTRRSGIIEGSTLAKSHTGVTFAVPLSIKPHTSRITRKFIPAKSHTGNLALEFGLLKFLFIFLIVQIIKYFIPSGVTYARSVFLIVSRSSVTVQFMKSTVRRREIKMLIIRLTHNKPTQVVNNNSRSSSNSHSRRNKVKSWL